MLPMAFVVTAAFPAASTSELIAVLKLRSKYSHASPGVGTLQHLAFEQLEASGPASTPCVPYKGAAA